MACSVRAPRRESIRRLLLPIQQLEIVILLFLSPSEQFLLLVQTSTLAEADEIGVRIANLDAFD